MCIETSIAGLVIRRKAMISYENTKTVQDLVRNTGREYAGRVFLRYEENDVVYEATYGEFADQCHAVAACQQTGRSSRP